MPGKPKRGRSPLILILLLVFWSLILGLGLAHATDVPNRTDATIVGQMAQTSIPANLRSVNTTDRVPQQFQLGQELYLENCAACHIGLPPAVLPTETWRRLLQDRQHYGQEIRLLLDPARLLVWNYLQVYSRPHFEDEEIPYRLGQSRYFRALHPRVKVPQPVRISSCVTCHPAAAQFNFRSLTPEWENAP